MNSKIHEHFKGGREKIKEEQKELVDRCIFTHTMHIIWNTSISLINSTMSRLIFLHFLIYYEGGGSVEIFLTIFRILRTIGSC